MINDLEDNSSYHSTAKGILKGFVYVSSQKEPSRLAYLARSLDSRVRAVGLFASQGIVELKNELDKCKGKNKVYAIVDEHQNIPGDGIEFDLKPEIHSKMTKSLLASIRRLHINTGHPPNTELERIVRLAGGSELAQEACKGIRCTTCRKSLLPNLRNLARFVNPLVSSIKLWM